LYDPGRRWVVRLPTEETMSSLNSVPRSSALSHDPIRLRHPILLTVLAFLLVTSSCCHGSREAKKDGKLDLSAPAAAKVDVDVRRTASTLLADGRGSELIPVLVRVTGSDARAKLEAAGMNVESVVGEVASGKLPAKALADVASLDAVIQVQLAHELEIK
jgi:hypothetical protein